MTFRQLVLTLGLGIGAILLVARQGHSQAGSRENCADHAQVVARLAEMYGERRQAIALTFSQRVIELFADPATGSWTLTVTDPAGKTCLIGAGEAFELTPEDALPGDPA